MLGLRVRGRGGRDRIAPVAAPLSAFLWGSTPFLCARAKKWGGTGSRCKRLLPNKTAHTHKAPTPTSPSTKSGEERPVYRGSSAHANGGDTEVKKALFFGGSTPFLWASTKEMGSNRRTGHRPPPNVSAHTYKPKEKKGEPPARVPPWTPPPLKRWTKLSNAREARSEVRRSGSGPGGRRPGRGWRWRRGSRRRSRRPR